LKRAQIENPEDSHSQGGILIEQDEDFNKVNVNSDNIETRGDSSLSTAANSEKKAAKESGRSRGDKPKRSRNRGNRNRRRRPNTGRGEKSSSQGGGSGDKS
jgi:hypothetical protein